jgi:hypothetical protein
MVVDKPVAVAVEDRNGQRWFPWYDGDLHPSQPAGTFQLCWLTVHE